MTILFWLVNVCSIEYEYFKSPIYKVYARKSPKVVIFQYAAIVVIVNEAFGYIYWIIFRHIQGTEIVT